LAFFIAFCRSRSLIVREDLTLLISESCSYQESLSLCLISLNSISLTFVSFIKMLRFFLSRFQTIYHLDQVPELFYSLLNFICSFLTFDDSLPFSKMTWHNSNRILVINCSREGPLPFNLFSYKSLPCSTRRLLLIYYSLNYTLATATFLSIDYMHRSLFHTHKLCNANFPKLIFFLLYPLAKMDQLQQPFYFLYWCWLVLLVSL
jgi:hypothetical protein